MVFPAIKALFRRIWMPIFAVLPGFFSNFVVENYRILTRFPYFEGQLCFSLTFRAYFSCYFHVFGGSHVMRLSSCSTDLGLSCLALDV